MGAMEDVGKVISDASKTWTRQGQRQDMSKTPAETPVEGARKRIPASRSSAVHRALEANRRIAASISSSDTTRMRVPAADRSAKGSDPMPVRSPSPTLSFPVPGYMTPSRSDR